MAKKVVATLKKEGGQVFVKCIKMVKNPCPYQFKSAIMDKDLAKDFFKK